MKVGQNKNEMEDATSTIESMRIELEQCHQRIGELARAESLLAGENRLLEMVARGAPLSDILTAHCQLIEELSPGSLCGILLYDQTNNRVEHGAAPSLPKGYNDAIHHRIVTPEAGPCGTALCLKEQVIAADIATDPRWDARGWRMLALAHDLRSCWSTPIMSCAGKALGTFAIYWREPRRPTAQDQRLIEQTTHLAAVAIERRRTEEALRASEDDLTEAIDTIPGLVWSVLPDGEVDFLNRRWCEYTGLTLEQARGWGWSKAIHPDDRARLDTYWRTALALGKPSEIEARLRRSDGTFRWFLFRAVPLYDEAGKLVKWYGQNTDIDDRKCAEQAVRTAKARFEGILEIAEDTIISVDSAQRIVLFNQGAEKVFGCRQEEVVGQPLDLLLPQRFMDAHRAHVEAFGKSPEISRLMGQRREVFGRRKDGSEFPAEASISKLDLDGELTFTVILRDITERRRAAEALRASEHLARGQLEALRGSLAALARESEPEKFLEHVLRFTCSQLDAHSISFWTLSEQVGCVELLAVFEEDRLRENPKDFGSAPLELKLEMDAHPVWTPFFQTGEHCVYGRVSTNPPHSRIALDLSGPWHDWQAPVVANPNTPRMISCIAASGITATLCIPMIVSGKVTGMFSIRFKTERPFRREEIELTRAMTQQAMLAIQLMRLTQQSREAAVIAERNRMARDMHDTLAQGFTGVIMQLEAAKGAMASADASSASAHIERAEALARSSLCEARRSVHAMRSPSLVDGTLSTALNELLQRVTGGTELQAELVVQGDGRPIPADWEEGLLRIAQESLTNTLKYAHARHFRATLSFLTNALRLQLADDGCGFDPRAEHEGFGLVGMQERAEQMGGSFVLRSTPGQGTEIVVELNRSTATTRNHENPEA